jgi:hypothetical protein
MKMAAFWVVAPCRLIALMMEAIQTYETLVNSYQSTRRYNPEDSHLYSHRRENLKKFKFVSACGKIQERLMYLTIQFGISKSGKL